MGMRDKTVLWLIRFGGSRQNMLRPRQTNRGAGHRPSSTTRACKIGPTGQRISTGTVERSQMLRQLLGGPLVTCGCCLPRTWRFALSPKDNFISVQPVCLALWEAALMSSPRLMSPCACLSALYAMNSASSSHHAVRSWASVCHNASHSGCACTHAAQCLATPCIAPSQCLGDPPPPVRVVFGQTGCMAGPRHGPMDSSAPHPRPHLLPHSGIPDTSLGQACSSSHYRAFRRIGGCVSRHPPTGRVEEGSAPARFIQDRTMQCEADPLQTALTPEAQNHQNVGGRPELSSRYNARGMHSVA